MPAAIVRWYQFSLARAVCAVALMAASFHAPPCAGLFHALGYTGIMRNAVVNRALLASWIGCALIMAGCQKQQSQQLSQQWHGDSETKTRPQLSIEQVIVPENSWEPLTVRFVIRADGDGPVALARKDFMLEIWTHDQPNLFDCDLVFGEDVPNILRVTRDRPISLTAISSKNEKSSNYPSEWGLIRHAGKYILTIRANGAGPQGDFPNHSFQGAVSNQYELTIK